MSREKTSSRLSLTTVCPSTVASFIRNACNLSLLRYFVLVSGGIAVAGLYLRAHVQLRKRAKRGRGMPYARGYTSEIVELFNTGDIDHRGHAICRLSVAELYVKFNPVT